jgi:hypothetical protein
MSSCRLLKRFESEVAKVVPELKESGICCPDEAIRL